MKTTDKRKILQKKIAFLKNQQTQDLQSLKEQFHLTYNSFKPLNVLKNALSEVTSSSEMKKDLLMGALNLTTGYLSHKIADLNSNPIKNILGKALKFVIKKVTGKKQDKAGETEHPPVAPPPEKDY